MPLHRPPTRRPTSRAAARLAALALALAMAGGCGQKGPDVSDAYDQLMKRPDVDQAQAAYTAMTAAIRERLTAEFGRTWEQGGELSGGTCGNDYPGLDADGRELRLPRWDSPGNLPDNDWSRAQALVGQIAAGYGFNSTPKVFTNQPGTHTVAYGKPDGALLHFGTGKYTTLRVETGCHLTAEAHRRGGPKPD
ncbi:MULTISPECIES: LppA family lipoprotein [unclassified Amycolatopsis]|uniref:LppA family lipoprotein n=1 Tax=unclassified Amycolatopsis TaxID=2618356 RepID=UPI00106EEDC4|nr:MULTISPECIES: LppA family lipoprotein [unclassified Amycolatopsis]